MGRRSRAYRVINAPETIYAKAKTAGWLLKSLGENATWDARLFECLQWLAGGLRRPLQNVLKEAQLLSLGRLTPGDFHAVRSQYDPLFADAVKASHKIFIDALAKEQSLKVEQQTRRIGFAGGQA